MAPSGESLEDATNRAIEAVNTLVRQYFGRDLFLVTHNDICATLAGHAEGTSFDERYRTHGVDLGLAIEIVIGPEDAWKILPREGAVR